MFLEHAKIGKAILIQAIGIAHNHKILHVNCNACSNCPHFSTLCGVGHTGDIASFITSTSCAQCPHHKEYEEAKNMSEATYVNEKNRFGDKKRLSNLSLKLLVLYHFYEINATGLIMNINIKDVAQKLECTVRSVRNCNTELQNAGYLYTTNSHLGIYSVYIPEYQNYFKSASQGGRGYITLSKELLDYIISIKKVTPLRMALRTLSELDTASNDVYIKNINDIRLYLPEYCRRNVICKFLDFLKPIFKAEYTAASNSIRFEYICEKVNVKSAKPAIIKKFKNKLIDFKVSMANDQAYLHNNKDFPDIHTLNNADFFEGINLTPDYIDALPSGLFSSAETNDLAELSYTYTFDIVREALKIYFKEYFLKQEHIESLGGLIRTIIRNNVIDQRFNLQKFNFL